MKKTVSSRKDTETRDWKYLFAFCAVVSAIVLPVFGINFFSDPGEIYFQKLMKDRYIARYTRLLLSSPVGMREFGNERVIKADLAGKAGAFDTVIIGSSHVMQVSPVRMPRLRSAFPGTALNLGVSGGSLEDTFIFAQIITQNAKMPKAVIFDVAPWGLKWGMDSRFAYAQERLDRMLHALGIRPRGTNEPYMVKLLRNSVSIEYFWVSVKNLIRTRFKIIPDNPLKAYGQVEEFDFEKGYDYEVTLNDGSHVYDRGFILTHSTSKSYVDDGGYKLRDDYFDPRAVTAFEVLIDFMRKKGAEVYFILMPYHHSVFRDENATNRRYITEVENKVRDIATRNKVHVFGSYDPRKMSIAEDEFFDTMHPKPAALNKIDFSH